MSSTQKLDLLSLPDEILLLIIKAYLAVPTHLPRIRLDSLLSPDSLPLKLSCRRLRAITLIAEKGQRTPRTLIIASPATVERILDPKLADQAELVKIERLIFTDLGLIEPGQRLYEEERLQDRWKKQLGRLIASLICSIGPAGRSQTLPRLTSIAVWPDTVVEQDLTSESAYLTEDPEAHNSDDSVQEAGVGQILYDSLVPLSRLLCIPLTVHSLDSTNKINISHFPHSLHFCVSLDRPPSFAPRFASTNLPDSEHWEICIPEIMTCELVPARAMVFLHQLDTRRIRDARMPYPVKVILRLMPAGSVCWSGGSWSRN